MRSAALGAMFSILALDLEAKEIKAQVENKPSTPSRAKIIAGAVLGSVVGVAVLLVAGFFWLRRRRAGIQEYFVEPTPNPLLAVQTAPEMYQTIPATSSAIPASLLQQKSPKRSRQKSPALTNQSSSTTATLPTTSPSTRSDNLNEMINELVNLRREVHEIRGKRNEDPPPL